jgi:hypothetical protein
MHLLDSAACLDSTKTKWMRSAAYLDSTETREQFLQTHVWSGYDCSFLRTLSLLP